MPDFVHISVIDILDILLVGIIIWQIYKLMRTTSAVYIFFGIIVIYLIWLIVKALDMELLSGILGQIMGVGVLALIILFQPEIRRFLMRLGSQYKGTSGLGSFIRRILGSGRKQNLNTEVVNQLEQACSRMADRNTGALIVIQRTEDLSFILETGDKFDASIHRRLIENIFFKNSPLHDGALLIIRNRIAGARCTLPMSENQDIPASYGMRHRAALGLSEQTDAFVIVVSEQTGHISVAVDGQLRTLGSITELRLALEKAC